MGCRIVTILLMSFCQSALIVSLIRQCFRVGPMEIWCVGSKGISAMACIIVTMALMKTRLFVTTATAQTLRCAGTVVGVLGQNGFAMDMFIAAMAPTSLIHGPIASFAKSRTMNPVLGFLEIAQSFVMENQHVQIIGTKHSPPAHPAHPK